MIYNGKLTIDFYNDDSLILLVDPNEAYNNLIRDTNENDDLIVELKRGGKVVVSSTFKTKDIQCMYLETRAIE